MRQFATVICIVTILSLITACSIFRPANQSQPPMTTAAALWQYITTTDLYTEWKQFGDTEGMLEGAPPHGPKIKIYPNRLANESVYTAKENSIIVMENYDKNGTTLLTINLMQKRSGYAPSAGNWFWATYEPDGTVIEEGRIKSCVECHVSMAFDDYTFIHQW